MMAKKLLSVVCAVLAAVMCFTFVACNTTPETENDVEYTVTFDANGGQLDGNSTVKVQSGNKISGAPTATKENCDFDGWFTAAEAGDEIILADYVVTKDVKLYAQYTEKTVTPPPATEYTVTFDANGGTLKGNATLTVKSGEKIVGAPTAENGVNLFEGWFTAKEGGEKVDLQNYTVTGNVTLYAHYEVFDDTNPNEGPFENMPIKTLKNFDGTNAGYRIEAEAAKFDGTLNSEDVTSPVESNIPSASGNQSLGYLGVVGNTVTFTFKSASAGKATISLRGASNNSKMDSTEGFMMWVEDQEVSTADFTVAFNGKPVNFAPATLRGAGKEEPWTWNKYFDPILFGDLNIYTGVNVLKITVAANTVPNLDCLDIVTNLSLSTANGEAASGEASLPKPPAPAVVYNKDVSVKLIVGGYEGGPAIEKAIIGFTEDIPATAIAESNPLSISMGGKLGGNNDKVYLCDVNGEKVNGTASRYVAIEYEVKYAGWSFVNNLSPFKYAGMNQWKDFTTATLGLNELTLGGTTYTKYEGKLTVEREIPCLEGWNMEGKYTNGDKTLTYGYFAPEANSAKTGKKPLIVWLHGAGEGGTDPSIAVLGNQVTNLSKPLIQDYFVTDTVSGAYVLAPQSPTMWMDNGNGQQGGSDVGESIYTETLFKLIENFVKDHSDIDANRVYLGGCSNGGWMTVEMLSKHGEFFAAAYPIAVPFDRSASMTADEFTRLSKVPMWITHAKADNTVKIANDNALAELNSNSLYIELLKAGATNVHYSLFDTVTVDGVTYDGHWSWIFTLRDECNKVQATTGSGANNAFVLADLKVGNDQTETVTVGGKAVSLWGWLAAQKKA